MKKKETHNKILSPIHSVRWTATLLSIAVGETVEVPAGYRETNTIRNAASNLGKKGYDFKVSKTQDDYTTVTRYK